MHSIETYTEAHKSKRWQLQGLGCSLQKPPASTLAAPHTLMSMASLHLPSCKHSHLAPAHMIAQLMPC